MDSRNNALKYEPTQQVLDALTISSSVGSVLVPAESTTASAPNLVQLRAAEAVFPPSPAPIAEREPQAVSGSPTRESTTAAQPDSRVTTEHPVFRPRLSLGPRSRFELLQQWEGAVLQIGEDSFRARMRDLTDTGAADEEMTFGLEDVSDPDRELLEEGAVFYFSIGYQVSLGGQKTRAAQIRFRRLPAWSRAALERIEKRSAELEEFLGSFG